MSTVQEIQEKTAATDQNLKIPSVTFVDVRPYRPFKSCEEYLYAMKEDLVEWLRHLYGLEITIDNFMETLENGAVLCKHANNMRRYAGVYRKNNPEKSVCSKYKVPDYEVVYREAAKPGTFFSRDNVHNFIYWCRKLGIFECLLFETDDLVLRKNEKSFILCLLEVARRGSRFGMPAPVLVHLEKEIDRDQRREEGLEADDDDEDESFLSSESSDQMAYNKPKDLDHLIQDLVKQCSCPEQFPMIKLGDGKYRIGDTKVLIYIRVLRNHVMVRVGGGWDTLQHYLEKHDPCRCRSGSIPNLPAGTSKDRGRLSLPSSGRESPIALFRSNRSRASVREGLAKSQKFSALPKNHFFRASSASPNRSGSSLSPLLFEALRKHGNDNDDKLISVIDSLLSRYRAKKVEKTLEAFPSRRYRRNSIASPGSRIPMPIFNCG